MNPRRYLLLFLIGLPLLLTPLFAAASVLLFYRNDLAQGILLGLRQPTEVLYFGDSVLGARSACDSDQRSIPQLLATATGKRVLPVANAGYSSRQYLELAGLLTETAHRPSFAVIGINLRSFGPGWANNPGFLHANDMRYVRALQGDLSALAALTAGRVLGDAADDSWLDQPFEFDGQSYGTLREIGARSVGPPLSLECQDDPSRFASQVRLKFLVQYLFRLPADSAELSFVVRTAQRLRGMGVTPVLYLTPINIVEATAMVGPAVGHAIQANATQIVQTVENAGFPVLNLSSALGPEFFADKGCACEHLRAEGRSFVAEQVARRIRSLGP